MKKFFLLGFIFLLCGCGTVDDIKEADNTISNTVDTVQKEKYALAKNSVSGYANAVKVAYTDYKYHSLVGDYEVLEGSTSANVDGTIVDLNISYSGSDITCGSISIVGGNVILDDCSIYGYTFSYDGVVRDK